MKQPASRPTLRLDDAALRALGVVVRGELAAGEPPVEPPSSRTSKVIIDVPELPSIAWARGARVLATALEPPALAPAGTVPPTWARAAAAAAEPHVIEAPLDVAADLDDGEDALAQAETIPLPVFTHVPVVSHAPTRTRAVLELLAGAALGLAISTVVVIAVLAG